MNERIQELADQAEDYADAVVDRGGEFHPAYTEKLAELIVQKCCDMFVELRTRPADLAALDVKKHFGVE